MMNVGLSVSVLMAVFAWSRAASAQEVIHIEIDAMPISAAPELPAASAAPKVVIAPIADATGMFPVLADRELLDSALRAAIAERPDAEYEVVQLPPSLAPCDRSCEVTRARLNEARYLVVAEIRLFAGAYVMTIEIVRTADAKTLRTIQTDAVDTPPALLSALKATATQTAAALFDLTRKAGSSPSAASTPPASLTPTGGWNEPRPSIGKGLGVTGDAASRYLSKRNAGIALFVIGILAESAGGFFLGYGSTAGCDECMIGGGIAAGVGALFFWTGLGVWVSNHVRMNKALAGIPTSLRLRLDGLSPIVASRERGAPGLSAAFSF